MRRILLSAALLAAACNYANAATRKVLFIGNSYIYTNNLPSLLQQMATSMGDTLIYDEYTVGGYTLQAHSGDIQTKNKIYSQQWDIVVIQEQSQRPAFSPTQVARDTYPFARKLDSMVRDNRSCTETMFFMTWGYKNGDASNCAAYPPICTYAGMQQRLRESYLQMATDNNGIVSPVGVAWKQVRDSFPAMELYSPDGSHPSMNGSFLAACVFYTSIFHKSTVKSTFNSTLAAADAANLKRFASRAVLDSFNNWNASGNYTYANFTHTLTGNKITLNNTSKYATTYAWAFDDGNTSTAASPTHTYSTPGKYFVTLRASNNCFSEIKGDTISTQGTGITSINNAPITITAIAIGNGKVMLQNTGKQTGAIHIFDINGRKVATLQLQPGEQTYTDLLPGLYMYSAYINNALQHAAKLSVY